MRRSISIFVLFAMMICLFCGCSSSGTVGKDEHESTSPTDTPQPTMVPTPKPTPKPTPEPSFWSAKYYVDDFGDPTDSPYICGDTIIGTFSNSVTNNSELYVKILYDDNVGFRFTLLEYGRTKAVHLSHEELKFLYKINGATSTFNLKAFDGITSELYTGMDNLPPLDIKTIELFRDYLLLGRTFPCVIYIGTSKYSFEVNGLGFQSAVDDYLEMLNK